MCKSMFDVRHRSSKIRDDPLLPFFRGGGGLSRKMPALKLRKFGIKQADKSLIPTERRLKSSRFEG